MCLDCGCHRPDDTHDDSRHIVLSELRAAAEVNGISTVEAARRILAEAERVTRERMAGPASNPPFDPKLIITITKAD